MTNTMRGVKQGRVETSDLWSSRTFDRMSLNSLSNKRNSVEYLFSVCWSNLRFRQVSKTFFSIVYVFSSTVEEHSMLSVDAISKLFFLCISMLQTLLKSE